MDIKRMQSYVLFWALLNSNMILRCENHHRFKRFRMKLNLVMIKISILLSSNG